MPRLTGQTDYVLQRLWTVNFRINKMKKTLIALAVAGAAVATGVNAGELYNQDGTSLTMKGRVEAILSLKDGDASDESRTRLGFLGKQEINDNLYGLGYFEGQFTSDDGDSAGNVKTIKTVKFKIVIHTPVWVVPTVW